MKSAKSSGPEQQPDDPQPDDPQPDDPQPDDPQPDDPQPDDPQPDDPGPRSRRAAHALIVVACVGAVVAGALVHFRPTKASPSHSPAAHPPGLSHSAPPNFAAPMPVGVPGKWNLILNSDFDQPLNTSVWRPGWFGAGLTGPVNSNETACYSSSNVTFPGDGTVHLNLTATPSHCQGKRRPFTGAILTTNPADGRRSGGFTFRYGVVEAKVYVPGTGGLIANWPTVMTIGQVWPKDGEDDILEGLSGIDCLHFHSPGYAPGGNLGGCDPGVTPGWHTIASNWEPGSVTWYYDGIEVDKITKGVTSAPMYLVLLYTASSKGRSVATADSMRVAYVRVWKAASGSASRGGAHVP